MDRFARYARFSGQLAGAAWPQFLRPLALELASHRPIREVLPASIAEALKAASPEG